MRASPPHPGAAEVNGLSDRDGGWSTNGPTDERDDDPEPVGTFGNRNGRGHLRRGDGQDVPDESAHRAHGKATPAFGAGHQQRRDADSRDMRRNHGGARRVRMPGPERESAVSEDLTGSEDHDDGNPGARGDRSRHDYRGDEQDSRALPRKTATTECVRGDTDRTGRGAHEPTAQPRQKDPIGGHGARIGHLLRDVVQPPFHVKHRRIRIRIRVRSSECTVRSNQ